MLTKELRQRVQPIISTIKRCMDAQHKPHLAALLWIDAICCWSRCPAAWASSKLQPCNDKIGLPELFTPSAYIRISDIFPNPCSKHPVSDSEVLV